MQRQVIPFPRVPGVLHGEGAGGKSRAIVHVPRWPRPEGDYCFFPCVIATLRGGLAPQTFCPSTVSVGRCLPGGEKGRHASQGQQGEPLALPSIEKPSVMSVHGCRSVCVFRLRWQMLGVIRAQL